MGQNCASKCGCKHKDNEYDCVTDVVTSHLNSSQGNPKPYSASNGNKGNKGKGKLGVIDEEKSSTEDEKSVYSVRFDVFSVESEIHRTIHKEYGQNNSASSEV